MKKSLIILVILFATIVAGCTETNQKVSEIQYENAKLKQELKTKELNLLNTSYQIEESKKGINSTLKSVNNSVYYPTQTESKEKTIYQNTNNYQKQYTPNTNYENYKPSGCCKICTKGKACGDSCISRSYTCHKGPGCACDG